MICICIHTLQSINFSFWNDLEKLAQLGNKNAPSSSDKPILNSDVGVIRDLQSKGHCANQVIHANDKIPRILQATFVYNCLSPQVPSRLCYQGTRNPYYRGAYLPYIWTTLSGKRISWRRSPIPSLFRQSSVLKWQCEVFPRVAKGSSGIKICCYNPSLL